MAVINQKDRADHLAQLVRDERQRHSAIEIQFLRVLDGLEKQVKMLNEQNENLRSSFVKVCADNLRRDQQ